MYATESMAVRAAARAKRDDKTPLMMVEYGAEECDHIQHSGLAQCPGLSPSESAFAEKVRSVGLQFTAGRDQFHGRTLREQEREIMSNAKKYGHEQPEYMGPRSKGRPLAELKSEIV